MKKPNTLRFANKSVASKRTVTARSALSRITLLSFAALLAFGALAGQAQDGLPTVPLDDYGKFERLGFRQDLSPDGKWVAYELNRVDGSHELQIRDTAATTETVVTKNGRRPRFSRNSVYLAWRVELPESEQKDLEDPARHGAGLRNLATGTEQIFDEVRSFAFDEQGHFLALLGYDPEEPKGKGADLRLIDLRDADSPAETTFGNVTAMAWSDVGARLALTTATGRDAGNGIQIFDAESGTFRSLDTSGAKYLEPTWRKDALDLAVLRTVEDASAEKANAAVVLAWTDLDAAPPKSSRLDAEAAPKGMEIVRHRKPEWSPDGSRIAIGLRPCNEEDGCQRDSEEPSEDEDSTNSEDASSTDDSEAAEPPSDASEKATKDDEPDLPALQIWHSRDRRLFPEQKSSSSRDEQRTLLAVWHVNDNTLNQVTQDLRSRSELLGDDWQFALETTSEPYGWGDMFGRPYTDVWRAETSTGKRTRLIEKVRFPAASPSGKHILYFDGNDHHAMEVATGRSTDLTSSLGSEFANREFDTPTDQLPPYGNGGWLENDEEVLLYDRFDVWKVAPNGSRARRLTDGTPDQLIHRVADLDPEEEFHDSNRGLHFMLRNERTEQRGVGFLPSSGLMGDRVLASRDLLGDFSIRGLIRSRDAEVLVFQQQSNTQSPNVFTTDLSLRAPRQLSATNSFLGDYAWSRSELVDFTSEEGRELQAALLYPAQYEAGKSYPMIVYTYEVLAPQIHTFHVPDERRYYNFTSWTQAGYFVLLPDIVYTAREPGPSAVASVRAAVKSVTERGLVDEARVGLIGHSWGGYQATYLPTRTDIFAASVAGAPLTDFVSFMGQLHWNPGIAELSHWETGQARMEVPFWEDPEAHRRSSPIHKVHEMDTPLLMAFGNEDGVVDWDQGTEFFNFARRADKQMVLLVYEGEDHGFSEEANQKDYHRRILEWFGHYLKEEPAPQWITDGIAFEQLEDEKKRVAEDRPGDDPEE